MRVVYPYVGPRVLRDAVPIHIAHTTGEGVNRAVGLLNWGSVYWEKVLVKSAIY